MARTTILLLLVISSVLVVADQAAAAAKQLSPAAEKSMANVALLFQNVTDDVVSAAPPAKQGETLRAVLKHFEPINSALHKAEESGDDEKIADLAFSVNIAAAFIIGAPSDKKLKVMEDTLNSVVAPDPLDCPNVDKAYCETNSKIEKAFEGVVVAAPAEKRMEIQAAVKKPAYTARSTIDKAYADGDEKKIAQVLAAYTKAADEVIAAAPPEKFNVMEKTFAAAASAGN